MRTEILGKGHTISATLDGTVLTLGGALEIDLEAEQRDSQHTLTVFLDANGNPAMSGDVIVARIAMPPRRFDTGAASAAADGQDAGGIELVPVPLRTEEVFLQLWPIPAAAAHTPDTDDTPPSF